MKKNYKATFAVLLIASSYILLIPSCSNESSEDTSEIVISGLETTGSLTWYTSIPEVHAERIANAFTKESGIGVTMVRASTFIIRNRLVSEIAAGEINADVLTIADLRTYYDMVQEGLLLEYDSPHFKNIPDKFRNGKYWAVFSAFGICMAYDESRTENPPRRWMDLLDDRWKGRIGLEDINTAGSQYGMYFMLRDSLGVDFWRNLLSVQKPKIYMTTQKMANALLSGEIDVAGEFSTYTIYSYRVKKGTSLRGVFPDEGIPLVLTPTAIISGTEEEENAKKFTDFILSGPGQEMMQRLSYRYSIRDDIPPLEGMPSIGELNVLIPESAELYSQKRLEYIEEFNRFMRY